MTTLSSAYNPGEGAFVRGKLVDLDELEDDIEGVVWSEDSNNIPLTGGPSEPSEPSEVIDEVSEAEATATRDSFFDRFRQKVNSMKRSVVTDDVVTIGPTPTTVKSAKIKGQPVATSIGLVSTLHQPVVYKSIVAKRIEKLLEFKKDDMPIISWSDYTPSSKGIINIPVWKLESSNENLNRDLARFKYGKVVFAKKFKSETSDSLEESEFIPFLKLGSRSGKIFNPFANEWIEIKKEIFEIPGVHKFRAKGIGQVHIHVESKI